MGSGLGWVYPFLNGSHGFAGTFQFQRKICKDFQLIKVRCADLTGCKILHVLKGFSGGIGRNMGYGGMEKQLGIFLFVQFIGFFHGICCPGKFFMIKADFSEILPPRAIGGAELHTFLIMLQGFCLFILIIKKACQGECHKGMVLVRIFLNEIEQDLAGTGHLFIFHLFAGFHQGYACIAGQALLPARGSGNSGKRPGPQQGVTWPASQQQCQ